MAKETPGFAGFPKETLSFLCVLRANNSKEWFDAHRNDYDQFFVDPAKAFVEAMGPRLRKIAPNIAAEPRINGSIFRINRDTRFSKDKRPYKDHLTLTFWDGDKKTSSSCFFFRISPDNTFIGCGFHQGSSDQLKAFRAAVGDEIAGKSLARLAKKLRGQGYELAGQHYKRFPKGFSEDGPAAEFLLHNSLYIVHEDSPTIACSKAILETCLKHWKAISPLHKWLVENL